jgi:hypothetical protein
VRFHQPFSAASDYRIHRASRVIRISVFRPRTSYISPNPWRISIPPTLRRQTLVVWRPRLLRLRYDIRLFATDNSNNRDSKREPESKDEASMNKPTLRENIYTLPNALTVSRILACPVLGWSILEGDFALATSILAYAGISDWVGVHSMHLLAHELLLPERRWLNILLFI